MTRTIEIKHIEPKAQVRQLIDALIEATGLPKDFPVRELPGSSSDQFGLFADISRVRHEFGWSPRVELKAGLQAMADWARTVTA